MMANMRSRCGQEENVEEGEQEEDGVEGEITGFRQESEEDDEHECEGEEKGEEEEEDDDGQEESGDEGEVIGFADGASGSQRIVICDDRAGGLKRRRHVVKRGDQELVPEGPRRPLVVTKRFGLPTQQASLGRPVVIKRAESSSGS